MSDHASLPKDDLLTEARVFVAEQQIGHSLVRQLIDRVERAEMAARMNAETIREMVKS